MLTLSACAPAPADPTLGFHLVAMNTDGTTATEMPAGAVLDRDVQVKMDPLGNAIFIITPAAIDGSCIGDVQISFTPETSRPSYVIKLKKDCVPILAQVTGDNIGKAMAIVIDGEVISAPLIQEAITGGSMVIDGYGG
jgi:preprotein translocase subunit SecD